MKLTRLDNILPNSRWRHKYRDEWLTVGTVFGQMNPRVVNLFVFLDTNPRRGKWIEETILLANYDPAA